MSDADTKQTEIQRLNSLCDHYRTQILNVETLMHKVNGLLLLESYDDARAVVCGYLRRLDGPNPCFDEQIAERR